MRMLRHPVGSRREPFEQDEKLALVALKVRRRSSANFGIALRDCGHTVRPRER